MKTSMPTLFQTIITCATRPTAATSRLIAASTIAALSLAGGALVGPTAHASSGSQMTQQIAPIDRHDVASLQRGAKLFVNYCLGCHSAQHMRYNRLVTDLGLTDKLIVENLIFRGSLERDGTYSMDKIGDTMLSTIDRKDAKALFGVVPPDLSVEARVRGANWLYAYLRGFYRDDKSATGWNNLAFPNVAMPNVLWELSGPYKLVTREYDIPEQARGALLQTHVVGTLETVHPVEGDAAKSGAKTGAKPQTKYVLRYVEPESPGTMTKEQYETAVVDLVNFMDYMAEPAKNERIQLGIKVLIFLSILFVFAYWAKREYWKDVH